MSRRRKKPAGARQKFASLAARVLMAGVAMTLVGVVLGGNALLAGAGKALLPAAAATKKRARRT